MNKQASLQTWKKSIAPLLLAIVVLGLCIWFIPSKIFPVSWDFRNNLWGPAYQLLHRMSPYDIKVLFEISNAIWMPMLIGLLAPIGFLPLQWASNIWLLINLASLSLIVSILARQVQKNLIWTPLIIIALAIFPASISHFILGQVSLFICLVLLLLVIYRKRLNPIVIGLLLCLSLTKPQLLVLFLPAFLIIYFREQGMKKFLKVILYSFLWVFASCVPLFILFPHWIPDFLTNLSANNTWFYPSLYSFLISGSGSRQVAIGLSGLFLCIGLGISVLLLNRLQGNQSLLWILALTPIFSPIIWSWDFVLLFPFMTFMVFEKKSITSSWVLYGGYAICAIVYFAQRVTINSGDQSSVWVPLFLNIVLLISYLRRDPNHASNYFPTGKSM